MRSRVSKGWAVSVLLASVGCGQTRGVPATGGGAGGGDDDPQVMALDFAQSGSRLVALGYSSNEARLFRTFHDALLGFDCDFVPDAEGTHQRCVPNAGVTMVYTDAGCTEPAAWELERSGAPWAVGDAVSGISGDGAPGCPGDAPPHREAYRVAEHLSDEMFGLPPSGLFAVSAGQCHPAQIPGKITPAVRRLVPLAESELVRGQRVSLNVGGGLRLTRLIADDGAELSQGVTLADRTPCELQRDGECVPEPIARPATASSGRFWSALNADCTEPAFQAPYPPACGAAKFGVADDGEQPPKVLSLTKATARFGLDLVQPVTDQVIFACNAHPIDDSDQIAAPGRDLTGTLPTASRLQRGSGRLHVNWYSVGQSELLPVLADFRRASPGVVPTAEFVTDTGQPCEVRTADDGTLHCAVVDDPSNPIGDLTRAPEVVWGPL
jgi:hypothetical protein